MILFIDACTRAASRTRELAEAVLENIPEADVELETQALYSLDLRPLTEQGIQQRQSALAQGDFSDACFDLAKQFAAADQIIVAAPYWDFSFPAVLKLYIEHVSINGITFQYDAAGIRRGLCRANRLYYVTTAGGEIGKNNFGYEYTKAVSLGLFGIPDAVCIRAVGLDADDVDASAVLENAKSQMKNALQF